MCEEYYSVAKESWQLERPQVQLWLSLGMQVFPLVGPYFPQFGRSDSEIPSLQNLVTWLEKFQAWMSPFVMVCRKVTLGSVNLCLLTTHVSPQLPYYMRRVQVFGNRKSAVFGRAQDLLIVQCYCKCCHCYCMRKYEYGCYMSSMQWVVAYQVCILIALPFVFLPPFPHLKMIILRHPSSLVSLRTK